MSKWVDSFLLSTIEGANKVVGPTSRMEPIRCPILDGEPSNKFAFRWMTVHLVNICFEYLFLSH